MANLIPALPALGDCVGFINLALVMVGGPVCYAKMQRPKNWKRRSVK